MNWKSILKSFQSYLKIERGLSQNTIDNYTFDIERLCQFLEVNSISVSPTTISEETIQQFIYSLSKEVNARSQARMTLAIVADELETAQHAHAPARRLGSGARGSSGGVVGRHVHQF